MACLMFMSIVVSYMCAHLAVPKLLYTTFVEPAMDENTKRRHETLLFSEGYRDTPPIRWKRGSAAPDRGRDDVRLAVTVTGCIHACDRSVSHYPSLALFPHTHTRSKAYPLAFVESPPLRI